IGATPNFGRLRDNLGARRRILVVTDSTSLPRPRLDQHVMSQASKFLNSDRDHGHPVFIGLNLFRDADNHTTASDHRGSFWEGLIRESRAKTLEIIEMVFTFRALDMPPATHQVRNVNLIEQLPGIR